ncbi:phosphoribosylanthranilate isomerase [Pelagibacteraceae bacterium]|jgi:phosphoribosylanthranilate isomerase|nr:phosphoribosylanthranilate isomerase [Pelagibacteraceae bacterium]
MKLKACGLSNPIEIETCVSLNVNYCGFILNYPKSHRYISFDKAKELTKINKGDTEYVGVLVEPTIDQLNQFSELNFDYFQLYGNFYPDELMSIKDKFKKKIISSIQVKKKEDIDTYKLIENNSDIILWDSSGYEESLSWDYNWLKTVETKVEKMVAGNITIDKIKNLVNLADIVDVSGALETNKVKDINKIKEFNAEIKKISNES